MLGRPSSRTVTRPSDAVLENTTAGFILLRMLRSHRQAMSEIKSARQRARKATEERDKLKEKLKKAQARLAAEKERLRTSLEKLES
jgi:hypothetical protein